MPVNQLYDFSYIFIYLCLFQRGGEKKTTPVLLGLDVVSCYFNIHVIYLH